MVTNVDSGYFEDQGSECLLVDLDPLTSDYLVEDGSVPLYQEGSLVCGDVRWSTGIQLSDLGLAQADYSVLPPEDSYKSFLRLPPTVKRGSVKWRLAEILMSSYTQGFEEDRSHEKSRRSEEWTLDGMYYDGDYGSSEMVYQEDYLVSDVIRSDEEGLNWSGSFISEDYSGSQWFRSSDVVSEEVSLGKGGGRFFKVDRSLTGFLDEDVKSYRMEPIKTPPRYNISLPRNYTEVFSEDYSTSRVCYAFFSADLSAAGEPVFDPISFG
jgi:hypothetical protein